MIFEHQSKHKKTLFVIFIIFFLAGIIFLAWPEFTEAPASPLGSPSSFGNDQVEKAITDYLLTQNRFSWQTKENSLNFCSIENLDIQLGLFPLYIWAYCAEYTMENGKLQTISGSSGPVKVSYPNELSFYRSDKFSHEVPGDGAAYTADIKRIFPENVQRAIFSFDSKALIEKNQIIARENFLAWESIKTAISECRVEKAFQAHNRQVTVELKNGEKLTATEPTIDDIMKHANEAASRCGNIQIATE